MMKNENELLVYSDWMDEPRLIGTLYSSSLRGKQIYSFEYSKQWITDFQNIILDPDLYNGPGRQYVPEEKKIFGFLSDCLPDRWGRKLLKRKEEIIAAKERRNLRELTEYDFLTGVNDESRMGGLRFKLNENTDYIAVSDSYNVPPLENIRKLEQASLNFEKTEFTDDKSLQLLLAPGSSLGGARPKATVKDENNILWIAKFPSKHDEINVGAWEMVVHDLAVMCNLNVPEAKLENFSKTGSTFLTKRFDREGDRRIHFASAMTLLGKKDGADASAGSSYMEIASIIKTNSATPGKDLLELWRRIVFNMAVSNTDDHLRNHGFVLVKDGWSLSPLYDVNPNIYGDTLSLNVDSDNNLIDFNLALSVAKMYGLSEVRALEELQEIKNVVESNWRKLAQQYGLSRSEIEGMAPAFDMSFKG